jgi:iron complex outermembrane recepter protein
MPTHRFAPRYMFSRLICAVMCSALGVDAARAQPPEPPPSAAADAAVPAAPEPSEPDVPAEPPAAAPDLQVRELPQQEEPAVPSGETAAEGEIVEGEDEPSPAAQAEATSADMVVTGSRIRRKDLTGSAPIQVISHEQIVASGRPNVGEFLQTLPEQSNAIGRGTNNGGDGTIMVNLRGIGAQSTLVLLNGRRLAPGGTGANIAADLSAIPTQVIERIEVLKEGASAVYGSDAIAGVVNIITRKPFDGAEATVFGSTSTRGDGRQIDVNGTLGVQGEKGGMLISFGYYDASPAWAGNRDYSSVQRAYDVDANGVGVVTDLGSPTTPAGVLDVSSQLGVPNGNARYNDLIRANPTAGQFTYDPSAPNGWRPFLGSQLPTAGDGYNYQPYNYLVTPQTRFNVFASGDYKLSKWARAFFDSYYSKRNSSQTLAPEPLSLAYEGVTVSADNLYNPFGRDFTQLNRRLVEFDRRNFQQDIHNFHLTAGLEGDLPEDSFLSGWFWDAVFGYNRNEATELKSGNVRNTRVQDALGPSFVDETGAPRCGTAASPIDGCVPLNLFGGPGSITREQIESLTFTGVKRGYNQIISGQANIGGPLFRLWSEREVGLAIGYEFRAMSGGAIPDPITAAGETSGNKEKATEGKYRVNEVYGELSVPIVEKLLGLYQLELTAATRASFYNNFGSAYNYKFGARWAPIEDFTLRGTYSTAFRAPNINELYQGVSDSFVSASDPCAAGVDPATALGRSCGAAANNGDQNTQLRSRVGGNPDLKPETARIFTLGVVVRPRALKELALTLDYFNTKVSNTISSIGENVITQGCYPAADGTAPKYCGLITRDPATQRIMYIDNRQANSGEEALDGIDITGSYDLASPLGRFNLFATAAYLWRYDRVLADGTVIRGAGTFDLNSKNPTGAGRAGAFPHLRFNVALTWALAGWSASLRSYFIGPYKECGDASGSFNGGLCSVEHQGERQVDPYNTWDLTLGYAFASDAGRTSVTLGVTNMFDVAPPRVYNGAGATTDTYAYDMLMRQVYARIGHQF